ncbi:alpha/beta hydrolase [Massilia frigida]|uniref:alpha/beta hydrolase n=1 Tax=Massilia frigida TaxID=2609281 RepID=UPI00351CE51F
MIPDVRPYPEVRYPDFLDDSARAVAWTVREIARYGGDPARLFVMGHSSGPTTRP